MPRERQFESAGATVYAPDVPAGGDARTVQRLRDLLARAEDRAAWIQDICAALGEYSRIDELLAFIMDRIRLIMDAERTTLFMLESDGSHLTCRDFTEGAMREIRLEAGQGIAGWVALHGTSINVRDAYKDPRFDPAVDEATGFRTRSVLCQAMRDGDGKIIGVVQVLNKRAGYFSVDDELLLSATTNTAAIVIQNRRLYLDAVDRNMQLGAAQRRLEERIRRLDTLHEIHGRLATATDPAEVLEAVACSLGSVVASYSAAVTLLDGGHLVEHAFTRSTPDGRFVPSKRTWDNAVRAHVIETGETVARTTDEGRADAARITGRFQVGEPVPVHSIAAVPLTIGGETIGCVELVNRCARDDEGGTSEYTDEDLKVLDLVAGEISVAVARSMRARRREMQGRLSAIGHMLSGVVHDLRTPITVANGYLQLIARADDPARRAELAGLVSAQFDHIGEMTRELLAYARGETTLYRRNVHLHILVDELRELLQHEFTDHVCDVQVETSYRGDVRIDDGKLKRVLFNLARNARDAMPPGGCFCVRFEREADDLLITVSDTGGGIPPEIQATAFDAFVTASKRGGSGLGLAIVKKLVDEHGGDVSFVSEPGVGTTFTIRLPDVDPNASPQGTA